MDQTVSAVLPAGPEARLDLSADLSHSHRQRLALADFQRGLTLWRLGATLGWLDIKLKYRGSLLGPFWLTISTAVWIAAMGGLYSTLFRMDLRGYLPFLALSLVLWTALGGLVGDACNTFLQSEGMIRSIRMPYFVHALRVVVRTVISLLHNVPVIVGVFLIFGVAPGLGALAALPGLALWLLDAFAVCLLLGAVCARFRDVPPIVGSVMQIAFFVTPVMWQPEQLRGHTRWLVLNPFNSLLEVVREPLLGGHAGGRVWAAALLFSLALCAAAWLLFARVRGRLAFWV